MLLGDAAAGVFDDELDRWFRRGSARIAELVARAGRVSGIADEIEQELLDVGLDAEEGVGPAGISTISVTPRRSRLSRKIASTLSATWRERHLAGVAGGASCDIEHPAEDAAADLDRPLELGEVCRGERRVEVPWSISARNCWTSGSTAPRALFTSCETPRARSAIACLRSAISTLVQ